MKNIFEAMIAAKRQGTFTVKFPSKNRRDASQGGPEEKVVEGFVDEKVYALEDKYKVKFVPFDAEFSSQTYYISDLLSIAFTFPEQFAVLLKGEQIFPPN